MNFGGRVQPNDRRAGITSCHASKTTRDRSGIIVVDALDRRRPGVAASTLNDRSTSQDAFHVPVCCARHTRGKDLNRFTLRRF
jgi:hypothetical protein